MVAELESNLTLSMRSVSLTAKALPRATAPWSLILLCLCAEEREGEEKQLKRIVKQSLWYA